MFAVINGVSLFALVIGILTLVYDALPVNKNIVLYTVCIIASGMILLPIAAGLCVKIAKRLRKQKKRADFEKPRAEVRIHSRSSYSRQI